MAVKITVDPRINVGSNNAKVSVEVDSGRIISVYLSYQPDPNETVGQQDARLMDEAKSLLDSVISEWPE